MRYSKAVCFIAIMGVLTTPAYAYLDPGTGSMILQGILGAIAIGAASFSVFWQRVKNFFSRNSSGPSNPDHDDRGR